MDRKGIVTGCWFGATWLATGSFLMAIHASELSAGVGWSQRCTAWVIGAAVALVLTVVLIAVAAGLERRANAIDRTQPANRALY